MSQRPADPALRGTPVHFLVDEVADICGALALGAALLQRLGLGAEASRLESLFGVVQGRLAEAQPAAGDSAEGASARSLSGS